MKKIIALLLTAVLLSGLVGCGRETVQWDPTYKIPTNTQATFPTDIQPQQLPMVSVSLPVVTQDYSADNGTVIYSHTSQNISLIVPDPEVADKVILDFLNRTDMQETVDSFYASASGTYKDGVMAHYLPYWTQITYAPMRIDSGVLSLYGSYVQYSGGAHPMESAKSVTYDLLTGEALSLTDILTENTDADTLCQLVLKALDNYQKEMAATLYTDYEATVTELFNKPLAEITNWCLTGYGLSFHFSPYEIGAYTYGIIPAHISYEELTGILRDAYFPAERDIASGTVTGEIFDPEKLDNFTQFSEVVIDRDGQAILLSTDGMVYNVEIMTGTWNEGKTAFVTEHTVFRACSLTPGDAIMVQCDPDCIYIQYSTGNGTTTVFPTITDGVVTLK